MLLGRNAPPLSIVQVAWCSGHHAGILSPVARQASSLRRSTREGVDPSSAVCISPEGGSAHRREVAPPTLIGVPHRNDLVKAVLVKVNGATKWGVMVASCLTLALKWNENVMWSICGSILAVYVGKGLKEVINQARPHGAEKCDPGMPSTHAVVLSFLSTYILLCRSGATSQSVADLGLTFCILPGAFFLAWLRVALGLHTWGQVLVGGVVGASLSATWHHMGATWALPAVASNAGARVALYITTAAAVTVFLAKTVAKWRTSPKPPAAI